MALSGISPSMPDIDDTDDAMPETVAAKAELTHRTLTGLVCGASMSASLGAASVALGQIRHPGSALRDMTLPPSLQLSCCCECAPTPTASSHRSRHIRDDRCRRGFRRRCQRGSRTSAIGQRSRRSRRRCRVGLLDRTDDGSDHRARRRGGRECLPAAVVPLACWVGGVYGLARGLSLT